MYSAYCVSGIVLNSLDISPHFILMATLLTYHYSASPTISSYLSEWKGIYLAR